MINNLENTVKNTFIAKFNTTPIVVCSPGRINLIGEHTDYNMGFVLPAAIDKAMYMAIAKQDNDNINLFSLDLNDNFSTSVLHYSKSDKQWANYIIGVVDELLKMGIKVSGFSLVFAGDVPLGAGLSSSAALECATVFALNTLFDMQLTKLQMAQIAQQAEREYVGVKCGIMDQFASIFGKKNHLIKLDCRSLAYEYVPFNLVGVKTILFDSMVKHSLASSEYNIRSQQCQQGVNIIQKKYPEVKTLRDANSHIVEECLALGDIKIYNRCKFVVNEIARLQLACQYLTEGNLLEFGKKMYETHQGLSQLYEVSCPELDFMANCAKQQPNIIGARMMGGGFGGCIIALIKQDAVSEVIEIMKNAYQTQMGKQLKVYEVNIEDGTRVL
ncbi:MAG: galactokinase [Sphingobacteriales bacterium]|nr:MAG: galactokinase [Sphingobacteriales bacterium]TAF80911.1 MAG: galactokinase [Sphingobacteriales bacterium]